MSETFSVEVRRMSRGDFPESRVPAEECHDPYPVEPYAFAGHGLNECEIMRG
jgi:hypothetical protein